MEKEPLEYERPSKVCERRKCSRTTLWRDIRKGLFPAPRQLGGNAIGFIKSEVDEWLANRPRVTYAPEAPNAAS
jgi:prophage regulatory protein